MAVEDDIHGAAAEKIYGLTFGTEHPYGWPTIGWMKDIEAYTVPDCESFYRTWYAPNNATVVLVGDFDTLDVLRLFRQHYGPLKASEVPEVAPPPSVMSREYQSAMLEWPTPTAKVALTWMAPAYGDSDYAAALVLDEILTGGRSGRLRRRLVRDLEYVSEISTSMTPLRYPGLFEVWISMRPDQEVEEALTVVNEELARLQSSAVAEAELEKVRNRMELFFLSEIESVHGKAYQIGFADNVLAQPAHAFERLEELRRVRAEDVQRVARRLFAEGPVARLDVTPKVSA
jgi:zinc protease